MDLETVIDRVSKNATKKTAEDIISTIGELRKSQVGGEVQMYCDLVLGNLQRTLSDKYLKDGSK